MLSLNPQLFQSCVRLFVSFFTKLSNDTRIRTYQGRAPGHLPRRFGLCLVMLHLIFAEKFVKQVLDRAYRILEPCTDSIIGK